MIPKLLSTYISSVGACFLLSVVYVSSLYIWSSSQSRDHPSTIKRRFFSVFIMMFISPLFVYIFASEELLKQASIMELLGFRSKGFILALVISLLLTMILFLGPLCMSCSRPYTGFDANSYLSNISNLIWWRNHIVAPLSEEFTFRACMLPLLLQYFESAWAILICPLFFGVAHFHHMLERLKSGMEIRTAIFISSFQFLYTTLFGIYSAYLFVRTGHFVAPFVAHAFCNHMGFPDFQDVLSYQNPKKQIICMSFIIGLILWSVLLYPLTTPSLYANDLFK